MCYLLQICFVFCRATCAVNVCRDGSVLSSVFCVSRETDTKRNIITVVQVSSCHALTGKVSVVEAREAVAQDSVARRDQVLLVDRRVTTVRVTSAVAFVKRTSAAVSFLLHTRSSSHRFQWFGKQFQKQCDELRCRSIGWCCSLLADEIDVIVISLKTGILRARIWK